MPGAAHWVEEMIESTIRSVTMLAVSRGAKNLGQGVPDHSPKVGSSRARPAGLGPMFREKRVLAVLNPSSGTGSGRNLVATIERKLREHGAIAVEVRVTTRPEDAFDWAAAAGDEGFDVVLAGGGDGTVTAVAHGVLRAGSRLPIGILPLGTGNGLARVLGLPIEPRGALDALSKGRIVQVDAVDLPSHDAISLLFFGAGLDAKINRDADAAEKKRLGPFAYLKATFQNLRRTGRRDLTLVTDGEERSFRGHTVSGFNATRLNLMGMPVGPDADPHDGLLNLTVMRSRNAWVTLGQLLLLTNRAASRRELVSVRSLRLDAVPSLPVQADGDVIGETPLEAVMLPSALRFIASAHYRGDKRAVKAVDRASKESSGIDPVETPKPG